MRFVIKEKKFVCGNYSPFPKNSQPHFLCEGTYASETNKPSLIWPIWRYFVQGLLFFVFLFLLHHGRPEASVHYTNTSEGEKNDRIIPPAGQVSTTNGLNCKVAVAELYPCVLERRKKKKEEIRTNI